MRSYVPGERRKETRGLRPNVATAARSGGRGLLLGGLRGLVAEFIRLRAAAQLLEARRDLRGIPVVGQHADGRLARRELGGEPLLVLVGQPEALVVQRAGRCARR